MSCSGPREERAGRKLSRQEESKACFCSAVAPAPHQRRRTAGLEAPVKFAGRSANQKLRIWE